MTTLDKRLDEIERMLSDLERDAGATHRPDPLEMTDAECVAAVCRLCHRHPPGWQGPKPDPAEEARIVAQWRELNGR